MVRDPSLWDARIEDGYYFICVLIISYNIADSYYMNVTPLT